MTIKRNLILAIESSCDETSVAVVEDGTIVHSNIVASQIKSHMRFGGVVPEIASRHHVEQITQCIEEAMTEADVSYEDLSAVAVTQGPGLVGALLIGVNAAKAVAFAHQLPLIAVNHMAGHIYANRLIKPLVFPLLALVVSGGHTELVYMKEDGDYTIIGETRDDAAGEAYDKIGRVLGLPYPGGKKIDEMAHLGEDTYHFPRAMLKEDNYDFSFSGIKTAVINIAHKEKDNLRINDMCNSFETTVCEELVDTTLRVVQDKNISKVVLAGGVSANLKLRQMLKDRLEPLGYEVYVPDLKYCTDNAAMIGSAAYFNFVAGKKYDIHDKLDLNAIANLKIEEE